MSDDAEPDLTTSDLVLVVAALLEVCGTTNYTTPQQQIVIRRARELVRKHGEK